MIERTREALATWFEDANKKEILMRMVGKLARSRVVLGLRRGSTIRWCGSIGCVVGQIELRMAA